MRVGTCYHIFPSVRIAECVELAATMNSLHLIFIVIANTFCTIRPLRFAVRSLRFGFAAT
jgi:hypothetical protein